MRHTNQIMLACIIAAGLLGAGRNAASTKVTYAQLIITGESAVLRTSDGVEELDPPAPMRRGSAWTRTPRGRFIEDRDSRLFYLDQAGATGWEMIAVETKDNGEVFYMQRTQ